MQPQGKLGVLTTILSTGLVPNYTAETEAEAFAVAKAVLAGGCPVIEFLNRGTGAAVIFERLAERVRAELPGLVLGAGTITEPGSASQFINAGAQFIVGPNFEPEVARTCNRRGIVYIPGCFSATEIGDAMASGADIIKVFPATAGPAHLRALKGPYPHALFMQSGGVATDESSLREWFGSGAAVVSIGSNLFPPSAVKFQDWPAIETSTRNVLATIDRVRAGRP